MLEMHNGKERNSGDWAKLFQDADARFHYIGARLLAKSRLGLIEAVWKF